MTTRRNVRLTFCRPGGASLWRGPAVCVAPLTPPEITTIRERSAEVDDDLLRRSEREARAGARIVFWREANAPGLKDDEQTLI